MGFAASIIILLWVLPWKGYALWTASHMRHKKWFIALLILNTLGILEIYYIFAVAKKSRHEVWETFTTDVRKLLK